MRATFSRDSSRSAVVLYPISRSQRSLGGSDALSDLSDCCSRVLTLGDRSLPPTLRISRTLARDERLVLALSPGGGAATHRRTGRCRLAVGLHSRCPVKGPASAMLGSQQAWRARRKRGRIRGPIRGEIGILTRRKRSQSSSCQAQCEGAKRCTILPEASRGPTSEIGANQCSCGWWWSRSMLERVLSSSGLQ